MRLPVYACGSPPRFHRTTCLRYLPADLHRIHTAAHRTLPLPFPLPIPHHRSTTTTTTAFCYGTCYLPPRFCAFYLNMPAIHHAPTPFGWVLPPPPWFWLPVGFPCAPPHYLACVDGSSPACLPAARAVPAFTCHAAAVTTYFTTTYHLLRHYGFLLFAVYVCCYCFL